MLRRLIVSLVIIGLFIVPLPAQAGAPLTMLDPAIRTGTLDNGIRFFILKNSKPENRIILRLVIQAGSLQETAAEAGLAHLIEHMEFEGTEHFGPQEIVNFLEANGMRFGGDLNASTSFTNTSYYLNLPADNPDIVRKGIAILEDWAHGPLVKPELLAKEKKIIAEEDRLRSQNIQGRSQIFTWNTLLAGTPYANHLPIGKMELVQAFSAADIRHFVDTWYTPKAMSIVIVGSLDRAATEKILRDTFRGKFANAGGSGPVNPPTMPLLTQTSSAFFQDPELRSTDVTLWKIETPQLTTIEAKENWDLVSTVALGAINKRLADIARRPESSFKTASVDIQQNMGGNYGFIYDLEPRDGQTETALASYVAELTKAAQFGLNQGEFDLGRQDYLASNESDFTQQENLTNTQKSAWIADWIINTNYFPFTDALYTYRKARAGQLSRQEVNDWLAHFIIPGPYKLILETPEKPGVVVPHAAQLGAIIEQSLKNPVNANAERVQRPLVTTTPKPGSIIVSEPVTGTPFTHWILSNGFQVYLYRNSLTKNDFQVRAFAPGGRSTLSDADFTVATYGGYLLRQNGVGDLDFSQLQDYLNGMRATVNLSLSDSLAIISGVSDPANPQDMQKFFQLLYKKLTAPRRDSAAETTALANLKEQLINTERQPTTLYQNALVGLLTADNPRTRPFTSDRLSEVSADKAAALQHNFFTDGNPFTFVITGDFNENALKVLVETWLASIQVRPEQVKIAKDLGIRPKLGPLTQTVKAGHDDKAVISLFMEGAYPYSAEDSQRVTVLQEILNIRLREVLRQEKEGTYGVGAAIELSPEPYQHLRILVSFTCAPKRQDEMIQALKKELTAIGSGNISNEVFAKALEIRTRNLESAEKTNAYWLDNLFWAIARHDRLDHITTWSTFYAKLTKAEIVAIASRVIKPDSALVAILNPEDLPTGDSK